MTYLDIKEKGFAYMRDEGIEKAKEFLGEDDYKDEITLDDSLLESTNPEVTFDSSNGTINYSCSLMGNSKKGNIEFGYISDDISLDLDIVVEIVQYYMKKLGKLKTVLEATK